MGGRENTSYNTPSSRPAAAREFQYRPADDSPGTIDGGLILAAENTLARCLSISLALSRSRPLSFASLSLSLSFLPSPRIPPIPPEKLNLRDARLTRGVTGALDNVAPACVCPASLSPLLLLLLFPLIAWPLTLPLAAEFRHRILSSAGDEPRAGEGEGEGDARPTRGRTAGAPGRYPVLSLGSGGTNDSWLRRATSSRFPTLPFRPFMCVLGCALPAVLGRFRGAVANAGGGDVDFDVDGPASGEKSELGANTALDLFGGDLPAV